MSETHFLRRQERLKSVLSEKNLDGMLITNLTNVRYLSGFTGSAGTCLMTPDGQHFITDGRYIEMSKAQVKGFDRHIDSGSHIDIIHKQGLLRNGCSIAFEGDVLSVNEYRHLKELFPQLKWESTSRVVEEIAAVKDDTELDALRTAVEITDQVYEEVLPMIKVGVTEKTIANQLVLRYREYGDGEAYPPIVATGANGALPHAVPGEKTFAKGDFVVIDAAAKYAGYHADMTRTPVVGEATDRHREIYEIVLEAQLAGCQAAKAGVTCKAVDSATRDLITERGYGEQYIHSTGHGLGLEIHTMPRLSQQSTDTLQENYVVTIEPGIYIAGWGGVRIEDDVIIRKDQAEILNQTSKELIVLS